VYDDRIEFFNGGSLLFDKKLVEEGDISEPCNPLIINAFRMVHLAKDAGSGFYKIFSNLIPYCPNCFTENQKLLTKNSFYH